MSDIPKYYRDALRRYDRFMHPNWPIASAISLGDYGLLEDGRFHKKGSLVNWKFHLQTTIDGHMPELQLDGECSTGTDAEPEIVLSHDNLTGEGKARVNFTATRRVSVVAADVCTHRISNLIEVENFILQLQRCSTWNPKYSVITSIVESQAHLIAIASGGTRRGHLLLSAKGTLATSLTEVLRAKTPLTYTGKSSVQTLCHVIQPSAMWFGVHQLRTVSLFAGGNGSGSLQPMSNSTNWFGNNYPVSGSNATIYIPSKIEASITSALRLVQISSDVIRI